MVRREDPGKPRSGSAFSQVVVGLGGRYDRLRADAVLEGEGATSVLHTAHVGSGDQVHDLRTMQVHVGRRTTSQLRSKAAVAGHAGSIYSGLIAMRHGARRAVASQVNTSLVLSDDAFVDTVPNLDIEENDVQCSHASSVGPVDAEQRWYLESRGVAPADAVQLILEGFFDEVERLDGRRGAVGGPAQALSRIDVSEAVEGPGVRAMSTHVVCELLALDEAVPVPATAGGIDVVVVRCGTETVLPRERLQPRALPAERRRGRPPHLRDRVRTARRDVRPRDRGAPSLPATRAVRTFPVTVRDGTVTAELP